MGLFKCCLIGVASVMGIMLTAFNLRMLLNLVGTYLGVIGQGVILAVLLGCLLGFSYWLHSKG